MGSGRNWNTSKLLWLSLLPTRMKKLELSQHFPHYKSMESFPDTQEQPTRKSLVRSCQISNPSKALWLSLKKIQSKMKALEWSQDFSYYNPKGAICCQGNQSSDPIWLKTQCSLSQTTMHDAPDKIWFRSACWSRRYSCLKVWNGRMDAGSSPFL